LHFEIQYLFDLLNEVWVLVDIQVSILPPNFTKRSHELIYKKIIEKNLVIEQKIFSLKGYVVTINLHPIELFYKKIMKIELKNECHLLFL